MVLHSLQLHHHALVVAAACLAGSIAQVGAATPGALETSESKKASEAGKQL
jgi:hypothetical protein